MYRFLLTFGRSVWRDGHSAVSAVTLPKMNIITAQTTANKSLFNPRDVGLWMNLLECCYHALRNLGKPNCFGTNVGQTAWENHAARADKTERHQTGYQH